MLACLGNEKEKISEIEILFMECSKKVANEFFKVLLEELPYSYLGLQKLVLLRFVGETADTEALNSLADRCKSLQTLQVEMMNKLDYDEVPKMTRLVQNIIETNSSANDLPTLQVLSLHQLTGDEPMSQSHSENIKEMLKSLQFSKIKLTAFSVMDNLGWAKQEEDNY